MRGRPRRSRDWFRGEPVVRCSTEAIARRPTSTSHGSTCASSAPCSRPPPAARRLSAWHCDSSAAGVRAIEMVANPIVGRALARHPKRSSWRMASRNRVPRAMRSRRQPRPGDRSPSKPIVAPGVADINPSAEGVFAACRPPRNCRSASDAALSQPWQTMRQSCRRGDTCSQANPGRASLA